MCSITTGQSGDPRVRVCMYRVVFSGGWELLKSVWHGTSFKGAWSIIRGVQTDVVLVPGIIKGLALDACQVPKEEAYRIFFLLVHVY